jgi:hypothetical protein
MPFAENRADVVVVASSTRMVVTSRVAMNGEDWSGRFYGFTLTNPTFLVTHLSRITNRYHQKKLPGNRLRCARQQFLPLVHHRVHLDLLAFNKRLGQDAIQAATNGQSCFQCPLPPRLHLVQLAYRERVGTSTYP